MYHPHISAALAEQHRNDLIAQADAYRQARAARDGQPRRPGRSVPPHHPAVAKTVKRAVVIVTVACVTCVLLVPYLAPLVFLTRSPAGGAHLFAAHLFAAHLFGAHLYAAHLAG
jgi:hypothetical protein